MSPPPRSGGWLAVVVIGGAVLIALALATWEVAHEDDTKPPSPSDARVAAFVREADAARATVAQQGEALRRLVARQHALVTGIIDPGPEPAWYHPVEHATWATRQAARDAAIAELVALQREALALRDGLTAAQRQAAERERFADLARATWGGEPTQEATTPVTNALRWVWNHLLRPVLHWLTVACLLLFALNRLMRLALIRGWLGVVRLDHRAACGARRAALPDGGEAGSPPPAAIPAETVAPSPTNAEHRTPNAERPSHHTSPNGITLHLRPGERFWLHRSLVQGHTLYDWSFLPPHALGSVIGRWWHGMYVGLTVLTGDDAGTPVTLRGTHPRGNFLLVELAAGEEFHVRQGHVRGYSASLAGIHTRIRLWPTFFVLRRHFIACYQGPGAVLVYSPAPLERSSEPAFAPERVVAFATTRAFRALAPQVPSVQGQLMNLLWSHDVSWRFLDPGVAVVEAHQDDEDAPTQGFMRRAGEHLLGFLRW